MEKESVYLETSVVSYYTSRPSRDVIALAHQEITRKWWDKEIDNYHVFISEYVTDEAAAGAPDLAKKRLEALERFEELDKGSEITKLSNEYMRVISLPEKVRLDTLHIATASFYELDLLLSWNCKHIVNGHFVPIITKINEKYGLKTPYICTPEAVMKEEP